MPDAPSRAVAVSVRAVAAAAITASVAFPVNEVLSFASLPQFADRLPFIVAGTACYAPLFVRHVLAGLHGRRPRGYRWSLAVIAALLGWLFVVFGSMAQALLPALVVPVMLLLRPRWALALVVGVAAATVPVALTMGDTCWAYWYPVVVVWRSLTLYVLISLVAGARELERVRRELADAALLRERVRIDDELRTTVAAALADLAARAAKIRAHAATPQVPADLPALVAASRSTLADARRMVGRYQQPSLRAELSAAAALLGAAGVDARVVAHPGVLAVDVEDALRSELHAVTARLLLAERCEGAPAVLLGVRCDGAGARLLATPEVAHEQVTR